MTDCILNFALNVKKRALPTRGKTPYIFSCPAKKSDGMRDLPTLFRQVHLMPLSQVGTRFTAVVFIKRNENDWPFILHSDSVDQPTFWSLINMAQNRPRREHCIAGRGAFEPSEERVFFVDKHS